MRYPFQLASVGLGLIAVGLLNSGVFLLLIWLGLNFLALAVAHVLGSSALFGKGANGSLPIWSWVAFLPLHLFSGATWHMAARLSREAPFNRISEDLFIGRRLLPHEVPNEFVNYIDLTAEFAEPRAIRAQSGYRCFPILDAGTPKLEELNNFLDSLKPGGTYIHCAQGHGRTGLVALSLLLKTRRANTIEEGLRLLQDARPGLCMNRAQLHFAGAFEEILRISKWGS